ncbi:hypothetical protein P8C59_004674 [Phyllachora maydis]|uniref:Uncharacterized protein n=1 Tax=Phyllachora maydis TaxID=1825666 RepID=A0AAD9I354_9PEZI|nr:hypothetical protein P8C59_004674 [Phyllachora maydis]
MLINKFHVLEKRKMQALARGDTGTAAAIDADIEALGGLRLYQEASLQGQREDRGGDSSRVLVQWLEPLKILEHRVRAAHHHMALFADINGYCLLTSHIRHQCQHARRFSFEQRVFGFTIRMSSVQILGLSTAEAARGFRAVQ